MKRYKSKIKERRLQDFKAWYSLDSDWWYQFSSGLLHSETSLEQLRMSEEKAIKKGYVRVYVYDNTINIQSKDIPDEREFFALRDRIERNIFPGKIRFTIWETSQRNFYFRKQSFFFVDSIRDGR